MTDAQLRTLAGYIAEELLKQSQQAISISREVAMTPEERRQLSRERVRQARSARQ